jgi:hypothetical protein
MKGLTVKKMELAAAILINTIAFELGHIEFMQHTDEVRVWSTNSEHGVFHNTNLLALFSSKFSSYVIYNEEEKRCELTIF